MFYSAAMPCGYGTLAAPVTGFQSTNVVEST